MDTKLVTVILLGFIVFTSGCISSPTPSAPPPHPIPPSEFEFNFGAQNGTEFLSITLAQTSESLGNISVRIYIDDDLAYNDGRFNGPYEYSRRFKNEWRNGIDAGDTIKISKSGDLPFHEEVRIQATTESLDEYITIGSTITPRPNTQFQFDYHHAEDSTAIVITNVDGDTLQATDILVTVGGTVAYRNGTFQNGFGNGKEATNGWQSGVTKNATVILSKDAPIPKGTVVEIRREETLYLLARDQVRGET